MQRLFADKKWVLIAVLLAAPAGAAPADRPYSISVSPAGGGVHQKIAAKVSVRPVGAYHINEVYPTSLQCRPPQGLSLAKNPLNKADGTVDRTQVRFEVVATASSIGRFVVPCDLRFAVASDANMDPLTANVEFVIEVK